MSMTEDFFRDRLDQLIDLRHPLAVLVSRMPWQEIEASLAHSVAGRHALPKDRHTPQEIIKNDKKFVFDD